MLDLCSGVQRDRKFRDGHETLQNRNFNEPCLDGKQLTTNGKNLSRTLVDSFPLHVLRL
jgi:hypothetical protein